jgi:hypothetical protein
MGALLYLRATDAIRAGRPVMIAAGLRDFAFFGDGWRWPRSVGNRSLRRSRGGTSVLKLPLQGGRDYVLRLRIGLAGDAAPATSQCARVSLNGASLAERQLRHERGHMGVHDVRLPRAHVRDGRNDVVIEPCSEASDLSAAMLWYFRISSRQTAQEGLADLGDQTRSRR